MFVQKFGDNFWAKSPGHSSIVFSPGRSFLVWVGPQQIAQNSLVRNIFKFWINWKGEGFLTCWSDDSSNLLERFKFGAEAAVAAEDFFVDDCRKRETVDAICEGFPKLQNWFKIRIDFEGFWLVRNKLGSATCAENLSQDLEKA